MVVLKKLGEMNLEDSRQDGKPESENSTKKSLTNKKKLSMLEDRDRLIRLKMDKVANLKSPYSLKGTCPDMCPEKERLMRVVRNIIAPYECFKEGGSLDHAKAVKEYTRSSADQEEPLPHELRPEPVLTMTMHYLITQIMCKIDNEEDNLANWFDFCWGRLRAIRKDIIQQQMCDLNTVEIVEQCARFHIVCFERLIGCPDSVFDDKLNSVNLMNCLQSLTHMYEDLRKLNVTCPNEAEFKSYLILLNLNSGYLLSEYQRFPDEVKMSPEVKDAVGIYTAYSNDMYATFFKLLRKTSYLNACLMQRFVGPLRHKSLDILVKAYCPPNTKVTRLPVEYIKKLLKFNNTSDTVLFCNSFGIEASKDNSMLFISRGNFSYPSSMITIKVPMPLVVEKRVPVSKAVYGHEFLPMYIPHEVHSSFENDSLKEFSVDASDQEEKMLRDFVERGLLKKRHSNQMASIVSVLADMSFYEFSEIEDISNESDDQVDLYGNSEPAGIDINFDLVESKKQSKMSFSISPSPSPLVKQDFSIQLPELKSPSQVLVSPPLVKNVQPSSTGVGPTQTYVAPFSCPSPKQEMKFTGPVKTIRKDSEDEKLIMAKLRKKLTEKMKTSNLKRYAGMWKSKVAQIKKDRAKHFCFIHLSLQDHLYVWGSNAKSEVKPKTFERLRKWKQMSLSICAILHTNIINQLDSRAELVLPYLTNILSNNSLMCAQKIGNVSQPCPVYWKLLFTLPAPVSGGSTFPWKLRQWCKEAFYPDSKKLGDNIFTMAGTVPVFMSVQVTEGNFFQNISNVSALVLIRANGWETDNETLDKLNKILASVTGQIPVAILSLDENHFLPVKSTKISHLVQTVWGTLENVVQSIGKLAENTTILDLKVQPLGLLVEISSEKFLDSLHQDKYFDDSLCELLKNPNGAINLYNKLLDKIEQEINHCCLFNLYGTACEFKSQIKNNHLLFPEQYSDPHFCKILSTHVTNLKLKSISWNFKTPYDVLDTFKDYCIKLNCSHVLSKIIRMINPPDEDSGVDLSQYLETISWLPIVEILIKQTLKSEHYSFNIVYRNDCIRVLTCNHWWLDV